MDPSEYVSFFENITIDTPIEEYEKVIAKDAYFKDPFHEVKGVENIYKIFQKMYQNLESPEFKIDEVVSGIDMVYIRWYFSFRFKNDKKTQGFYGLSRVVFKDDKMVSHEDYWDSGENIYERIPVVSWIIRFVKNKIKS